MDNGPHFLTRATIANRGPAYGRRKQSICQDFSFPLETRNKSMRKYLLNDNLYT
jgi:hypothetical protein